MPTFYRADDKPVVQFDPRLEVSPFALFRRLKEKRAPLLLDVRADPNTGIQRTLTGARQVEPDWRPESAEQEVVLFDHDGTAAVDRVRALQSEGYARARALFGGLQLYEFSLDPDVVGAETFLETLD